MGGGVANEYYTKRSVVGATDLSELVCCECIAAQWMFYQLLKCLALCESATHRYDIISLKNGLGIWCNLYFAPFDDGDY